MLLENGDYITLRNRLERVYNLEAGLAEGKYEDMRNTAKRVLNQQYNALTDEQKKVLDGINLKKEDKYLDNVLDSFQYLNEKAMEQPNVTHENQENNQRKQYLNEKAMEQPKKAYESQGKNEKNQYSSKRRGYPLIVVENEGFYMQDEPIFLNVRR